MVTAQLPVPLHPPPDQPANEDPAAGVAVSMSSLASSNSPQQAAPQSMPAGDDCTDPPPVPALATVSENGSPSTRHTSRSRPKTPPTAPTLRSAALASALPPDQCTP